MDTLKVWRIPRIWNCRFDPVWLDCGSSSIKNVVTALDPKDRLCFFTSLQTICEMTSTAELGSNHFNDEGDGLYAIKCRRARTYWCYHPVLPKTICLLHLVPHGKTRQGEDLKEARFRQTRAARLMKVEEDP